MTTTAPITRPVTTDKPQTPPSRRRTAALVVSGVVMLGLAVGTTYAFVGRAVPSEQAQPLSAVQGIDRPGADAVAFARGTAEATATVRGIERPGADAIAFARGLSIGTTVGAITIQGADQSGADAVRYARTQGLTAQPQVPAVRSHSTRSHLPQGHAYAQVAEELPGS
jgi:hypothetical protein